MLLWWLFSNFKHPLNIVIGIAVQLHIYVVASIS